MLASVASQHDVSPSGIVGLIVGAGSAVVGLYTSFRLKLNSLFQREGKLAELIAETEKSEVTQYDHSVSSAIRRITSSSELATYGDPDFAGLRKTLEIREIRSTLARSRIAFTVAMILAVAAAGLFFYASFLVIFGSISASIVSALASAIPAAISYGASRLSNRADKRADNAMEEMRRRIDQDNEIVRLRESLNSVKDPEAREALNVLSTLKGLFPNATPDQLSGFVTEMITDAKNRPARNKLPRQSHKELD
jgi:hypothetical protein